MQNFVFEKGKIYQYDWGNANEVMLVVYLETGTPLAIKYYKERTNFLDSNLQEVHLFYDITNNRFQPAKVSLEAKKFFTLIG